MERLHLRAAEMELDDVGLLRLVVEAFLGGHLAQPLAPVQGGLFANTTTSLPAAKKKMRQSVLAGLVPASSRAEKEELDWRVDRVWEAHLKAHARFWTHEQGIIPRAPAQPNAETRAGIIRSLRTHDAHLLARDTRGSWVIESETRAAGIGIYYDPWMTGHDPRNDANGSGRRYLGHDRPWVPQRDKEDPVSRYAALYFEQQAIFDEQDRRSHERAEGMPPS
jgi:hypothetical protein